MAFEIVFVDGEHHLHHFAGGDFRLLVVFVEIETFFAADVAVLALDAERGGDELHGGKYLVGGNAFQDFDVLELLFGEFGSGGDCGAPDCAFAAAIAKPVLNANAHTTNVVLRRFRLIPSPQMIILRRKV